MTISEKEMDIAGKKVKAMVMTDNDPEKPHLYVRFAYDNIFVQVSGFTEKVESLLPILSFMNMTYDDYQSYKKAA